MTVIALKALSDNYIWLYQKNQDLVVIDPGEAQPVLEYLSNHQVHLAAILLTHDHADHTDGVKVILDQYPACPVYGPKECGRFVENIVQPNEEFSLLAEKWQVIAASGHTNGHIAYLINQDLFCGDALFMAGCGRVFTGDYPAQYQTLENFAELADDVKVYAAHEYSETNLRFAQEVDPTNPDVSSALKKVKEQRQQDRPTLPSTIQLEKRINPFMRAKNLAEFIELRKKRDNF